MHLLAGSRHDPPLALARLRLRGALAELRLDELRFTLPETTALLNEQLRLNLSADDLTTLYQRTKGWAAGLRLLAGSLQSRPPFSQRSNFIDHLAQNHRYIFDLLSEEVLGQQPRDIQAFLLETSILLELTPTLCQAVTGRPRRRRPPGTARQLLDTPEGGKTRHPQPVKIPDTGETLSARGLKVVE